MNNICMRCIEQHGMNERDREREKWPFICDFDECDHDPPYDEVKKCPCLLYDRDMVLPEDKLYPTIETEDQIPPSCLYRLEFLLKTQ